MKWWNYLSSADPVICWLAKACSFTLLNTNSLWNMYILSQEFCNLSHQGLKLYRPSWSELQHDGVWVYQTHVSVFSSEISTLSHFCYLISCVSSAKEGHLATFQVNHSTHISDVAMTVSSPSGPSFMPSLTCITELCLVCEQLVICEQTVCLRTSCKWDNYVLCWLPFSWFILRTQSLRDGLSSPGRLVIRINPLPFVGYTVTRHLRVLAIFRAGNKVDLAPEPRAELFRL